MANKKISIINDELDLKLLLFIARKNIYFPIIFIIIAIIGAVLYLRYTHPVYESNSIIQIQTNEEANKILGVQDMGSESELPRKIEVMRSFTFLQRVTSKLPLDIGYFTKGTILDYEQYNGTPYRINALVKNQTIYGVSVFIRFYDGDKASIGYTLPDKTRREQDFSIKDKVSTPEFDFTLQTIDYAKLYGNSNLLTDEYFFVINKPEQIVNEISSNLVVSVMNDAAQTIEVKYQDRNPFKATDIVNTITQEFRNYDIEKKAESSNSILSFIDSRLGYVYDSLLRSEERLQDFKSRYKLDSSVSRPLPTLYTRLNDYENELVNIELEASSLDEIAKSLRENPNIDIYKLIALTSGYDFKGTISGTLISLRDLLVKREQLLYDVTEQSGQIKNIDYQISIQKKLLLESISTLKANNVNRKSNINKMIEDYEKKLVRKEDGYDAVELSSLQRMFTINEKFYNQLIEKKVEYSINKAGFVSQNEILKKSEVNAVPVSPNKKKVYIVCLIAALLLGIGIIILKYVLFNEIVTVNDITKYTDTPVLGIVPKYKSVIPVSQLIVDKHPKSLIAESLRSIRTNLQFFNNLPGSKIIAITSTVSGEGKTFFAINLAGVIAFSNKRVIVIDLDLRRPKIHIGLGAPNVKGMSTILAQRDTIEDCIYKSNVPNLDFITAGPVPPNPSELIFSDITDKVMAELKLKYDFIIIDNPPVGLVTDGMKSLQIADFPIYVFKADYSKRFYVQNLDRLVEETKITKISLILNSVEPPETKYGYKNNYKYGYGYGYIYGYGYYDEDMVEERKRSIFQKIGGLFKNKGKRRRRRSRRK
ncbi:MAG: polysaccharide biosynthesis tyrosine autokinase [Bacteroidota bacterium]